MPAAPQLVIVVVANFVVVPVPGRGVHTPLETGETGKVDAKDDGDIVFAPASGAGPIVQSVTTTGVRAHV